MFYLLLTSPYSQLTDWMTAQAVARQRVGVKLNSSSCCGHKGTNKRAKMQIYLQFSEREIATSHSGPLGQRTFERQLKGTNKREQYKTKHVLFYCRAKVASSKALGSN